MHFPESILFGSAVGSLVRLAGKLMEIEWIVTEHVADLARIDKVLLNLRHHRLQVTSTIGALEVSELYEGDSGLHCTFARVACHVQGNVRVFDGGPAGLPSRR